MATDSTGNRRHFLGAAAAALAAAGVGVGFGCAKAQSGTPQLQGSEGNMLSLKGTAVDNGQGSISDMLTYATAGVRVAIGRKSSIAAR